MSHADCFCACAAHMWVPCALQVVSVDCNPAQSALLELKAVAIQQLDFEDAWAMFGEGKHARWAACWRGPAEVL